MSEQFKRKLALVKHPAHRLIIAVIVFALVIIGQVIQYWPPRVHWVGGEHSQPHKLAGWLLAAVLFAGFFLAYTHEPRQALLWALTWGLLFSFIVILQSILLIFKRRHS